MLRLYSSAIQIYISANVFFFLLFAFQQFNYCGHFQTIFMRDAKHSLRVRKLKCVVKSAAAILVEIDFLFVVYYSLNIRGIVSHTGDTT